MASLVYGVIGGGNGLGHWFVKYLHNRDVIISYSDLIKNPTLTNTYNNNNIDLVNQVDVVILAVPISNMCKVMTEIYPYLKGKILIEICSVKQFIVEHFFQLNKDFDYSPEFHSLHPMFGTDTKNLQQQVIAQTYSNKKNSTTLLNFRELIEQDGGRWHEIEYLEHDQTMAIIQSLNHFTMFVSAKTVQGLGFDFNRHKDLSSPTYRIFIILYTRYVSHNPKLYFEIQRYNLFSKKVIETFKEEVDKLSKIIESDKEEDFAEYVNNMKPYFESNQGDCTVSQQLIESLGEILKNGERSPFSEGSNLV